jgi:hypothetical protein
MMALMDFRASADSWEGSRENRPRSERGFIAGGRVGNLIGPRGTGVPDGGGDPSGGGDPGGGSGDGVSLIPEIIA